jgi:hypothetical protein
VTLEDIASAPYREQLAQMSEEGKWAGGGDRFAAEVWWLATRFKATSILDYGCGPGRLRPALKHHPIKFYEFDPGIKDKAALPQRADMVVCTDVLEHVEPNKLKTVLRHIHGLTLKCAFFVIALRPAEKRLPDGRNAHLIIDGAPWWFDQLCELDWDVIVHKYTIEDKDNAYFWTSKVARK